MIEIKSVTKTFDDFTAVENMSFTVKDDSVYGLVGYNGAGKTTLLKTIADVYRADSGEILIDGDIARDNGDVKAKIFYVPDDLFFMSFASMTAMARFYEGMYPNFDMEVFQQLAEVFGLDPTARIHSFSKGMQRQAEIVFALSSGASVLLLDESFDGLDPAKRILVCKLLTEYMAKRTVSVIISSHNLRELGDICDHIGIINGKKLTLDCNIYDISQNIHKFRLIFDRDVTKEEILAMGVKPSSFSKDGKIITLVAKGEKEALTEQLQTLNPLLIEDYPLSLEEIFISETEVLNHDITNIF